MSRRLRSGVRYRLAVLIALVVVVWVPLAGRAPAQNSDSLDQIKQRQDETTAEIAQARQELQSLQSQHQDLQVSVNSLTDQLTAANARLAQA
ncbi:MAG TPA: hypothetical protein VEP49_14915, partial [Acidimicrobiia bacterium]|nr:hypothetical protein [Acidimicrobiia bacterium]